MRAKGGKRPTIPVVYADLGADLAALALEAPAGTLPSLPRAYSSFPGRTILTPYPERPMQPSTMHRWWARCLRLAGAAHFPMHELRHTVVTEFLRANGGDLALAQRFARHASVATTVDLHGHLETDDLVRGWSAQAHAGKE